MRRTISDGTWEQVRTAHAAGIGLREIARNMGLPEGTVLAKAKRQGWSQQIAAAKKIAAPASPALTIVPADAVSITLQQRAERYTDRMAGTMERVLPCLETMPPEQILGNARNLEQYDRVARRTFGLENAPIGPQLLSLNILTNQALVQIMPNG